MINHLSIVDTYNQLSYEVSEIVRKQIEKKPNSRLILPTGSTPLGVYKLLTKAEIDWSEVVTFNLDEYLLNKNIEQSYLHYMEEKLFKHINIIETNYHFPDTWIHEGTDSYGNNVDLCLLGIGGNGHIAFNEPGSSFESPTRMVELSEETIKDNSRFFPSIDETPNAAITMGLKTIMSSKKIVLMAYGKHKKNILWKAMYGDVTEDVPASILQKHKNVRVFYCD